MSDNNYGKDPINDVLLVAFAIILAFVMVVTCVGCGGPETENKRTKPQNTELEDLKKKVLQLQGTITQINNFVASDFTNCDVSLPPFETKICQIAQTATAEQQIVFVGQLQQVSKIFQTELYGVDCINTTDPGCPIAGSVTERIASVEADVTDALADIVILQSDIASLNGSLASINSRLNNFNGSGSSIETVLIGVQADIVSLDNRIDDLEETVNSGDIYQTILICNDIANVGPAYEPILLTGDNTKAMAYISSGTSNGMGLVSEAGVTGNYFDSTAASTRACNYKIYDQTTSIKLCWKNDNRNASSAQIDTACNAPTFASPLATCTCAN